MKLATCIDGSLTMKSETMVNNEIRNNEIRNNEIRIIIINSKMSVLSGPLSFTKYCEARYCDDIGIILWICIQWLLFYCVLLIIINSMVINFKTCINGKNIQSMEYLTEESLSNNITSIEDEYSPPVLSTTHLPQTNSHLLLLGTQQGNLTEQKQQCFVAIDLFKI
eukprot:177787_1